MKTLRTFLTYLASVIIAVEFIGLISTHAILGYILVALLILFIVLFSLDKHINKRVGF